MESDFKVLRYELTGNINGIVKCKLMLELDNMIHESLDFIITKIGLINNDLFVNDNTITVNSNVECGISSVLLLYVLKRYGNDAAIQIFDTLRYVINTYLYNHASIPNPNILDVESITISPANHYRESTDKSVYFHFSNITLDKTGIRRKMGNSDDSWSDDNDF